MNPETEILKIIRSRRKEPLTVWEVCKELVSRKKTPKALFEAHEAIMRLVDYGVLKCLDPPNPDENRPKKP